MEPTSILTGVNVTLKAAKSITKLLTDADKLTLDDARYYATYFEITSQAIKRRFCTTSKSLVLLIIISAIIGCGLTSGQRQAVQRFGSATSSLGDVVAQELPYMRQQTIEMNVTRILLDTSPTKPLPTDKLESAFTLEATNTRIVAANNLKQYGNLLKTLVEVNPRESLETAVNNFTTSYQSLPPSLQKINQADLTALGQIVSSVGILIVESKKAEAIKIIVPAYSPQVDAIAQLLKDDLNPNVDGKLGSQFLNATEKLSVVASREIKFSDKLERRILAADALKVAKVNEDRRALLAIASEAASEVNTAQNELVLALENDNYTLNDINNFAGLVELLVNALMTIK